MATTTLSLRKHNALVIKLMKNELNRLGTSVTVGRKTDLRKLNDKNAVAVHFIKSGGIRWCETTHHLKGGS